MRRMINGFRHRLVADDVGAHAPAQVFPLAPVPLAPAQIFPLAPAPDVPAIVPATAPAISAIPSTSHAMHQAKAQAIEEIARYAASASQGDAAASAAADAAYAHRIVGLDDSAI